MPIFYNTSAPTPGNKNTITDIATNFGIRDFLLTKKLNPRYPQISTNVNGSPRIGEPVLDTVVGNNSNTKPDFSPIEGYSDNIVQDNFGRNTFRPNQDDNPYVNINYIQNINNQQFGDAEWPHGNQEYPRSSTVEIDAYGIVSKTDNAGYRFNNTSKNEYLDVSEQVDASGYLQDKNNSFSKQVNGYLVKISDTEYGDLNLGQSGGVQAANVIGSLLNGQGLGFSDEGLVTNFDLRSSLAGRALGLAGVLNDTELGIIGAQQLAIALGNNAAFNVQQEILGSLNVGENILNLIKEGTSPVFRPNYKITVPGSTLGRIADYTSRILGFTLPKSYLQDSGSIFQYENGNSENIARANAMLDNTGKGQIKALITNVNGSLQGIYGTDNPSLATFRSGYAAGYTNDRNVKSNDYNIYAYYNGNGTLINPLSITDDIIPDLSYKKNISNYGFKTPDETFTRPANSKIGYNNRQVNDVKFFWNSGEENSLNKINEFDEIPVDTDNKKSLLRKTQILFNSAGNRNIIAVKGDTELRDSTQISTANGNATSKGSAVLKKGQFTNYAFNGKGGSADDIFCRSWVATNRYDSIGNLIRRSALLRDNMPYRTGKFDPALSVLEDTGFVKIAPYKADFEENTVTGKKANVKNYMFSIENLAWNDNYSDLPIGEQGPGDSTTGRKGRIMWFPPYDINFSESVSVDWEATKFIGRGEPIYTYNNTERTGTLSFSIIVDHPTYANAFKNKNNRPDDNYVATFFAGCCILPDETLTNELIATKIREKIVTSTVQTQNNNVIVAQEKTAPQEKIPLESFNIYFPNDYPDDKRNSINESIDKILNGGIGSNSNNRYESGFIGSGYTNPINYNTNSSAWAIPSGSTYGIGQFVGGYTSTQSWKDFTNFGLNGIKKPLNMNGKGYLGVQDPDFFKDLTKYLNESCKSCIIKVQGYATKQGENVGKKQEELAKARAEAIQFFLKKLGIKNPIQILNVGIAQSESCKQKTSTTIATPEDSLSCKEGRFAKVTFSIDKNYNPEPQPLPPPQPPPQPEVTETTKIIETDGRYNFYNELNFFEKLTKATCTDDGETDEGGSFIFDSFREKIKYFHPAFHSTTPEGLNSRLTFLHQCTRQGPTSEEQGATNLAFGRAPICILRIGDFFYTKIAIDSLSIDYEPLVWDLNPEGIGVQPMIAKVTLGIKIIGGSSLNGPLNKLQNALSFNYYANTGVYDPRADYIEIDTTGESGIIKNGQSDANSTIFFDKTDSKFQGGGSDGLTVGENKPLSFNPSNQTEQSNKQLNGEVPSQSGTTSEPKITSIQEFKWDGENSNIQQTFNNTNALLFKIKLTSENIFDNNGNFVTGIDSAKLYDKIGDINIDINYKYYNNDGEGPYTAPGKKLVVTDDNEIKEIFNNGYNFYFDFNQDNQYSKVIDIYVKVITKNGTINKNLDPRIIITYKSDGTLKVESFKK